MKIIKMSTSSFWKGEAGVRGQVEEEGRIYNVRLYLKNEQVRDYSCTCAAGNSYKGMCAHGKALFDYYGQELSEAKKPPVFTSTQVHSMIREYTNREVARIMEIREPGQVRLVPVLVLERGQVRLEFKLGRSRLYAIRDLSAFCEAVEQGSYVEYGKELAFHHQPGAFLQESRPLLSMILALTEKQGAARGLELRRMNRDTFFDLLKEGELETRFSGDIPARLSVKRSDPMLALFIEKFGKDGIRVTLSGICSEQETEPVLYFFEGEYQVYIATGSRLFCCSPEFAEAVRPFLNQMLKEPVQPVLVGPKEIPLFYERVIKALAPFCQLRLEGVDFEAYKPEPLKARFYFESENENELSMEPLLSYGEYTFHPIEDENLPRTVCRDVPGEFSISQVIGKYFKYRDTDGRHFVIRKDEDALYALFDTGIEEFRQMGEVYLAQSLQQYRVLPPRQVSVGVSMSGGWLQLSVDAGDLEGQELSRILSAYSQKKKYYRLKNGQFLKLEEGGLSVVTALAESLGVGKKELQSGTFRLPIYRAMYLDSALKAGNGLSYYRDHLFKSLVGGMKHEEDWDEPVPECLSGTLREYQKKGYRWLRHLDRYGFGGILADDMGLGKTIQVIALLLSIYQEGEKSPSLVVCPASLVYNWEYELTRFAPGLKIQPVTGTGPEREALLSSIQKEPQCAAVLITSYDLLKRDIALYEGISFRFQIIDEAQYIKNAATQSAKSVKAIEARTKLALTGTPVENRLGELWSIFDYLMPGFLFGNRYFSREYELPIVRDGDQEVLGRLKKLISPFVLRRLKQDVLKELPDKLEQVVYSSLEGEQKRLYGANALVLKEKLEGEGMLAGKERMQILSELMRLRQLCCDPRLCYGNYRGGSAKLETCMDLIRRSVEGEHKLLLFSQFTSMLDLIEERLKKEGIECLKLTGATSKEERLQLVGTFSNSQIPVFLISLKAGGTGLNLTAADIVIHYDPWWNLAAQNQATDRTHRIGQKRQVTVYKLIARNTIEENILKLQESKQRLAEQIVTEGTGSLSGLTGSELAALLGISE